MWGGFAIGLAGSTLVYPFYAASEADPRRGMIFQGVAGAIGLGLGAALASPRRGGYSEQEHEPRYGFASLETPAGGLHLQSVSPLAVDHGLGVQLTGAMF
jgi:hypothetical protein